MPNPFVCKQTFCMKYSLLGSEYCAKHRPAEPDPNGFELQDDGTVTSAGNTSNTLKTQLKTLSDEPVVSDELRQQILLALGYSNAYHFDSTARRLVGVLLNIFQTYADKRAIEARVDEQERTELHTYDDGTTVVRFLHPTGQYVEKDIRLAELSQLKKGLK